MSDEGTAGLLFLLGSQRLWGLEWLASAHAGDEQPGEVQHLLPAASAARAAPSAPLIAERDSPVTPSNRQHLISTPKSY